MTNGAIYTAILAWAEASLVDAGASATGRTWRRDAVSSKLATPYLSVGLDGTSRLSTASSRHVAVAGDTSISEQTSTGVESVSIVFRAVGPDADGWLETIARRWQTHQPDLIDAGVGAMSFGAVQPIPGRAGIATRPEWTATAKASIDWAVVEDRGRVTSLAAEIETQGGTISLSFPTPDDP